MAKILNKIYEDIPLFMDTLTDMKEKYYESTA